MVDNILTAFGESDCSAVTVQRLELAAGLTFTLREQRLRALQEGDFDNLPGLRNLYMENNRLESLPENVFDGSPNLERLHLDGNELSDLPEEVFDGLDSLEQLRLDGNDLSDLPEDVFDGLTSLELLFLNDNSALGALPPEVFDGLDSLEELHLTNNTSLACIHPGQFDGLSALRELHLINTKLGNIAPTPHASRWRLNNLEELNFGTRTIVGSALSFQDYKAVFPALVLSSTGITSNAVLSDPICGSIAADADGSYDGTVRVELEETRVRPNRARASDAALLGDGNCGSDATATRHRLWTWQRSDDGADWTDMPSARQPKDYGTRAAGECSFTYTPQTDDNGKYVRAYVLVDTAGVGENNYPSAVYGPLNIEQP